MSHVQLHRSIRMLNLSSLLTYVSVVDDELCAHRETYSQLTQRGSLVELYLFI